MALNREDIIRRFNQPRRTKLIDAPELGGDGQVYIRMLNGEERERMELAGLADREKGNPTMRARMVQATLCDEKGSLLFYESDIKMLNTLEWGLLKRLTAEIEDFNGLTDQAREDAEKKSTSPRPADSSTGSPGGSASPNTSLLAGTPPPT